MSSALPYCRTSQTSSDVGMIGMITASARCRWTCRRQMEPSENSSMISRARVHARARKEGRVWSLRWCKECRATEGIDTQGCGDGLSGEPIKPNRGVLHKGSDKGREWIRDSD